MTFRAIRILKEVDLVLAEDTRTSRKLFDHYDIPTPMRSFHAHNEHKTVSRVVDEIEGGTVMAQVSDAGTPGISDPGFLLVRECLERGVEIEVLPGATAFVPALLLSGFAMDKFRFEGFLPHKKGRQTKIQEVLTAPETTILYESPHRVIKMLEQMIEWGGAERRISLSREISKLHEETVRGTVEEALAHFNEKAPKGEFVVVLEGTTADQKSKR